VHLIRVGSQIVNLDHARQIDLGNHHAASVTVYFTEDDWTSLRGDDAIKFRRYLTEGHPHPLLHGSTQAPPALDLDAMYPAAVDKPVEGQAEVLPAPLCSTGYRLSAGRET